MCHAAVYATVPPGSLSDSLFLAAHCTKCLPAMFLVQPIVTLGRREVCCSGRPYRSGGSLLSFKRATHTGVPWWSCLHTPYLANQPSCPPSVIAYRRKTFPNSWQRQRPSTQACNASSPTPLVRTLRVRACCTASALATRRMLAVRPVVDDTASHLRSCVQVWTLLWHSLSKTECKVPWPSSMSTSCRSYLKHCLTENCECAVTARRVMCERGCNTLQCRVCALRLRNKAGQHAARCPAAQQWLCAQGWRWGQ